MGSSAALDTAFLEEMSDYLRMPMRTQKPLGLLAIWTSHWRRQHSYMEARQERFKKVGVHELDAAIRYIWDGEDAKPNAALTVFRHFDSASVSYGLVGEDPETAWVLDYLLFERIHYLAIFTLPCCAWVHDRQG